MHHTRSSDGHNPMHRFTHKRVRVSHGGAQPWLRWPSGGPGCLHAPVTGRPNRQRCRFEREGWYDDRSERRFSADFMTNCGKVPIFRFDGFEKHP